MPFTKSDISSHQQTKKICTTRIIFYLCLIGLLALCGVLLFLNSRFDNGVGFSVNTADTTVHTSTKGSAHTTVHAITTDIPPVIRDPRKPFGDDPPECLRHGAMLDYPMTSREQELRRIYAVVNVIMKKLNLTYWPADGTLLGILRLGRVANDYDLDFHVLTSIEGCRSVLQSVLNELKKVEDIVFTLIRNQTIEPHKGVAILGLARVRSPVDGHRTGPDFFCVHRESNDSLALIHEMGHIITFPPKTLPLVPCRFYDLTVLCPGSGYALLAAFAPRYNGCMLFPHCFGKPGTGITGCRTPQRPAPLEAFALATLTLERCNYGNLADHFWTHPYCRQMMLKRNHTGCYNPSNCTVIDGLKYCFLQKFDE